MASGPTGQGSSVGADQDHQLFARLPICAFVVDLAADPPCILAANDRSQSVFGRASGEWSGRPAAQLGLDDVWGAPQNLIQRVLRGETVTAEGTGLRQDGRAFPARVFAALQTQGSRRMLLVVEDISAEKQRRSETEVVDAERHRIAREIHDGVAQNLAGLRFKLSLWQHQARDGAPQMRAALEEMLVVLNDSIADLRRAIFALSPLAVETLGFFPALDRLVTEFGDQYQLTALLVAPEPRGPLPLAYELPLFRMVQEGLHNIARHAQAKAALVRLAVGPDGAVSLSLSDNGRGFDIGQVSPADLAGHFGLRQMRERVLELGGTFEVVSTVGEGTTLHISLPGVVQGGSLDVDPHSDR